MSKVKFYLDSKQKARHRQRRYETMHKKFDEDSYILKGAKYRKDYDVQWSMT